MTQVSIATILYLTASPQCPLPDNFLHSLYVDNYLMVGRDPDTVSRAADRHRSVLNDQGLLVHETFGVSSEATFDGLDFDGLLATVAVSRKRMDKLRAAIDFILGRRCIS